MLTHPIKYHGGKFYLAKNIISLMPPRSEWLHYVEPYFGGGAVLLANDPVGISEVVNDLNFSLTNFWKVLQDREMFAEFQRDVEAIPFSQVEFVDADDYNPKPFATPDRIEAAVSFFVRCRQSLAGRMKGFTGITKTRTRRGMNNEVSAWLTAVDGLPAVHERLKRVLILNQDALDVIRKQDGPQTLFYCDPPYLHETRATTGEYGEFEMTAEQHSDLLDALVNAKGKVMLSGYRNGLYDTHLSRGWRRHDFSLPNNAAGGKVKRRMVESVWTNF